MSTNKTPLRFLEMNMSSRKHSLSSLLPVQGSTKSSLRHSRKRDVHIDDIRFHNFTITENAVQKNSSNTSKSISNLPVKEILTSQEIPPFVNISSSILARHNSNTNKPSTANRAVTLQRRRHNHNSLSINSNIDAYNSHSITKSSFCNTPQELPSKDKTKYHRLNSRASIGGRDQLSPSCIHAKDTIKSLLLRTRDSGKGYPLQGSFTGSLSESKQLQDFSVSPSHSQPATRKGIYPFNPPVNKEVRGIYQSILGSKDQGSQDHARLISKSRVIEQEDKAKYLGRVLRRKGLEKTKVKQTPTELDDLMIDKIAKQKYSELKDRITIYNRYYTDYLVPPVGSTESLKDLKVAVYKPTPPSELQLSASASNQDRSPILKIKQQRSLMANAKLKLEGMKQAGKRKHARDQILQADNYGSDTQWISDFGSKPSTQSAQRHQLNDILQEKDKMQLQKHRITQQDAANDNEKLFQLMRQENFQEIEYLLSTKPQLVHARNKMIETPLHFAAKRGLESVVNMICQCNPDYQAKDIVGRTPLEVARKAKHYGAAKILSTQEMYNSQERSEDSKA